VPATLAMVLDGSGPHNPSFFSRGSRIAALTTWLAVMVTPPTGRFTSVANGSLAGTASESHSAGSGEIKLRGIYDGRPGTSGCAVPTPRQSPDGD
jgi:hypothetical protein